MSRFRTMMSVFALTASLMSGCGKSAADLQESARSAMERGDYTTAVAEADQALQAAGTDRALTWQVEQLRLEAQARGGQGKEAAKNIERLATDFPAQVKAPLYLAIASYVKDAGDTSTAIDILAAGDKRFTAEHKKFLAAIDEMKNAQELDPAELEKLKSLGYL